MHIKIEVEHKNVPHPGKFKKTKGITNLFSMMDEDVKPWGIALLYSEGNINIGYSKLMLTE